MPVNFLETKCQETTNAELFGLCDDAPPSIEPAYINYDRISQSAWIAEVEDKALLDVTFTAIDNCIEIKRADGTDESRCDGFLTYDNTIIFVELKDRMSRGWIAKGLNQLVVSIANFEASHGFEKYNNKRAHIANLQRPFFESGFQAIIDEMKKANGFILEVQRKIQIR